MDYNLDFISRDDLKQHLIQTVERYSGSLESIDLAKFNSNLIDPIKMTFDSIVFGRTVEQTINDEILRQRDKTNNNIIGYFHQNIFQYFENCEVPKTGFDIVFVKDNITWLVELKNKHNTMNSSSQKSTYLKMVKTISNDPNCICALVEVIAKKSQNIEWHMKLENVSFINERLRRISIDKFYEIITGDKDSFVKLCKMMPYLLKEIIEENVQFTAKEDTVIQELLESNNNLMEELYRITYSDIWK